MGGEDEESAACVELFEGGGPGVEDVRGGGGEAAGVEGAEVEVGIVVEGPMDGDFDEPVAEAVGAVIAHEAGVVEEVAVAEKGQGVLAEFPGWGAVAPGGGAGEGPEDSAGLVENGGFFVA